MTTRKLFLHIGTEKTASTSIQEFVYANRQNLQDNGIGLCDGMDAPNNQKLVAYFQTHIDDYLKDHRVLDQATKDAFFDGFLDNVRSEIETRLHQTPSLLITSEHFHSRLRDTQSIVQLSEFLSPLFDQITVICYMREQSALATSFYSTMIKAGATVQYGTYLNHIQADDHYYNYDIFLDKWRVAFGAENMVVRLFDPLHLKNGNILYDILHQIDSGLDPNALEQPQKKANLSLGPIGLEMGRKLNTIYPRYNQDGTQNHLRWELMKALSQSRLGTAGKLQNPMAQTLYQMFAPSNRKVAQDYFGQDGDLFPPVPAPDATTATFQTDEDLAQALSEFLQDTFGSVIRHRVLKQSHGVQLRETAERLMDISAPPDAIEQILMIAQIINPGGPIIKKRLEEIRRRM
ncbi:hypothetical protein [Pseudaestuariivita rosea]|uniref:hypothetical protein n=1 Tax=Pseudaestuariivita rosea TaxID=2763263 RepID=UPI001ABBBF37|nr:hypothetical protein [Pseudaestuariivita rosea]